MSKIQKKKQEIRTTVGSSRTIFHIFSSHAYPIFFYLYMTHILWTVETNLTVYHLVVDEKNSGTIR